jgi:hypothetical protein
MHTVVILSLCCVQYGEGVYPATSGGTTISIFYQQVLKSQKLGICMSTTLSFPSGILNRPSAIIFQCKSVQAKW